MRQASDYVDQLKALLPPGKLWRDLSLNDSLFSGLLAGLAAEYARIDVNSQRLITESNPLNMVDLLLDMERFSQLPNDCVVSNKTVTERQIVLHTALSSIGGANANYFVKLAASIGYVITIDDTAPYQAGVFFEGVELTQNDWQYVWIVNGPSSITQVFTVLSGVNESLFSWDSNYLELECLIRRNAPAHTVVLFSYV